MRSDQLLTHHITSFRAVKSATNIPLHLQKHPRMSLGWAMSKVRKEELFSLQNFTSERKRAF